MWDYPRPPRIEPVQGRLRVEFASVTIADTTRALRVLETSGAPVYYFPQEDVKRAFLHPMRHSTLCEWKGLAAYWTLSVRGLESQAAAWSYPEPNPGYEELAGRFAFYAGRVDACYVNRRARPASAGRLLRRLGNFQGRRAVQRRARNGTMVSAVRKRVERWQLYPTIAPSHPRRHFHD